MRCEICHGVARPSHAREQVPVDERAAEGPERGCLAKRLGPIVSHPRRVALSRADVRFATWALSSDAGFCRCVVFKGRPLSCSASPPAWLSAQPPTPNAKPESGGLARIASDLPCTQRTHLWCLVS